MKRLIAIGILFGLASADPATAASARVPQAVKKPVDVSGGSSVALDPEVIEQVKLVGSWRSMTAEEYDAYYLVLAHARDVDQRELKAAAQQFQETRRAADPELRKNPDEAFPIFVDLLHNPKVYQGKAVTLRGHVRSFAEQPADENDHGVKTLYELWLYTGDSQGHPAVVFCTSVPKGFPKNEDLIDHVSVTGYFFKQFLYKAQDDKRRLTPMILAHRVEWHPERAKKVLGPVPGAVYVIVVVVIVVIVLLLWRSARKDRAYRQSRTSRDSDGTEPDFAGLDGSDQPGS